MKEVNTDIELFYSSPKGQAVAQALRLLVNDMLGKLGGKRILLIGSALPVAELLPRHTLIYDLNEIKSYERYVLPFSDCSFDYVLILHALEHSGDDHLLLREVWRIMEDGGKALLIAANRRGLWAGDETTPFGKGRPYSQRQINTLLKNNFFTVYQERKALLLPAFIYGNYIAKREKKLEKILGFTAGALAVEAEKTMYAPTPKPISPRVFSKRLVNSKLWG